MKIKPVLLFALLLLFQQNLVVSQNNQNTQDTVFSYLMEKCFELFKPHTELTYSFGTDELKPESPDLVSETPNLKDTTKYFDELKGDYKDWFVFYKIGNLYQRFNMGQSAMNYYNQAYNLIYNQIMKDTLNSVPYADMGTLYMSLNNGQNAFYFFQKAWQLNNKDSVAGMFLPMFYIMNGEFQKADETIKVRLANYPQSTDAYIWTLTSNIYQAVNKLSGSNTDILKQSIDELFDLKLITSASKTYKNDVRFALIEQMGRQLALLAKYSSWAENFMKAQISPSDQKELKQIQKNLEKILAKNEFKNKYIIYKSLGFNFLLQKDIDKAIDYFKKTIVSWPADKNSKDYYILFTTHYFINNDTVAALNVIDEKIKSDAHILLSNASDYFLKGNVLLAKRDFKGAQEAYNGALQVQQLPDAFLGLAVLEIKDHKLKEANQWINKAYDINKDYYLTYALFGIITIMNNQPDAAKDALNKAIQLKPDEKMIKEIYDSFFSK